MALSTYFVSAQSRTQMGAQTPLPFKSTLPSARRGASLALSLGSGPGLARPPPSCAKPLCQESSGNRAAAISARRLTRYFTVQLLVSCLFARWLVEGRGINRHVDLHFVHFVGISTVQPRELVREREFDSVHFAIVGVVRLRRDVADRGGAEPDHARP